MKQETRGQLKERGRVEGGTSSFGRARERDFGRMSCNGERATVTELVLVLSWELAGWCESVRAC